MDVSEKVHGKNPRFSSSKITYQTRNGVATCSYCGSISPKEALARLLNPASDGSGSDWKYGWPHKFYINVGKKYGKFYSRHLYDADPETLQPLIDALAVKLGIRFKITSEGELAYMSPYPKFQTWYGTGFDDAAPKVPDNI